MSEFRCRYSSDLSVLLPATGNAKNAISWFPNLIGDRPMKGRKFIVCLLFLFSLFAGSAAFATEPPRPGEIEALKKSGEYQKRLDNVRALGNHRIDKDLLKQALQRAKIQASAGVEHGCDLGSAANGASGITDQGNSQDIRHGD
jgi:hypothetical protein